MKEHCTAVVLAAGRGTRMGTQTAKQYLELQGKPILVYALEVFEQSAVVDDILLMTDKDHVEYCKKEICEKYGIKKVSAVAPGGKERYESVWKALCILKERGQSGFVMIHDGARPFITDEILKRVYEQGAGTKSLCCWYAGKRYHKAYQQRKADQRKPGPLSCMAGPDSPGF